jgi:hypothetical protein
LEPPGLVDWRSLEPAVVMAVGRPADRWLGRGERLVVRWSWLLGARTFASGVTGASHPTAPECVCQVSLARAIGEGRGCASPRFEGGFGSVVEPEAARSFEMVRLGDHPNWAHGGTTVRDGG